MCIRDRGIAQQLTVGGVLVLEGGQQAPVGGAGEADHTFHPVSYTHLRAHETVLDLVCRLLLEKKNRTKRKI